MARELSSHPVQCAHVFAGEVLAGTLMRTREGSIFEYHHRYLNSYAAQRGPLAGSLPLSPPKHVFPGANVHPFFAGLLPEGWRLQQLQASRKGSRDDFFSLLLAIGRDCVGDVSVCEEGIVPSDATPEVSFNDRALNFGSVLEETAKRMKPSRGIIGIAGVQEKVSAGIISLPIRIVGGKHSAWILKLNPPHSPYLVENEAFFMKIAHRCGLPVAETKLIHDAEHRPGLLVRRFDRAPRTPHDAGKSTLRFERIPQEDLCQMVGAFPADKYNLAARECMDALASCDAPAVQRLHLMRLWAFSYLIANGDLHAKNISIYRPPRATGWRLTPAYDLLSTLPYGDQNMALKLENRDAKLKRKHFVDLGLRFGIPEKATARMLDAILRRLPPNLELLGNIGFDARKTAHLRRTIEHRAGEVA